VCEEIETGWISAVRSSRQPLRGFLRMRKFLNVINDIPHAEERPWARLEARTEADARWLGHGNRFLHTRFRGNDGLRRATD
jgi:hypothetical protein